MTDLIEETWVGSPLEQRLDHFRMSILTGQVERGESSVVDAIHKTEGSQQGLDNVLVPIPRSFMKSSVSILENTPGIS